ncbi:hypothetical protein EDB81DRAFT_761873 [Dactylonectria macrodidyma]|uniref:Uncharacterized protein n=1 Tax=Dactylonectria macrodidyma TaxID=307937 RepID=A0A9P9EI60_9HYPO|nr:hypothetical protein EDB81DRAFT_761873 [Dactylonectria macrodidyma]
MILNSSSCRALAAGVTRSSNVRLSPWTMWSSSQTGYLWSLFPERFMGRLLLRGNWGSGISGSTVFASSNMIWVTGEGKLQAEHEIAPSKVPRSGLSDVDSHCPYDGIRD